MIEKRWAAIAPRLFVASGNTRGVITLGTNVDFRVKMIVAIMHPTLPTLELEVKRVVGHTKLVLGPPGKLSLTQNLSAYDNQSTIYAQEQERPNIPLNEIQRAVFAEEPAVATRVLTVDQWGDPYSVENPLAVQLSNGSLNIENLNANVQVQLSAKANDPNAGDVPDSVRIGDGVEELAINTDGSINEVSVDPVGLTPLILFRETTSVPKDQEIALFTRTVAPATELVLSSIEVGGENIATYEVRINNQVVARKRTHFGISLDCSFSFETGTKHGYRLEAGDKIEVYVLHSRPSAATFECRLLGAQMTLTP